MKVLVVGGGGREHALVWRLAQSPLVEELLAAPGNAGIAASARCVDVPADDVPGIVALVEREDVDLTVVGPEAPLVAGLADELTARGRLVFGPGRDAARIEGSKSWAKDVMVRHGIPTARSGTFTEVGPAVELRRRARRARGREGRWARRREGRDRGDRPRRGGRARSWARSWRGRSARPAPRWWSRRS